MCVSFNLGTLNVRDIRRSAFLIHRKIERILAQTPSQKIDIIGHSMGGLIGLYYVKKLGGHTRVRKLIMMGTPVRGTWAALAGVVDARPVVDLVLAALAAQPVPRRARAGADPARGRGFDHRGRPRLGRSARDHDAHAGGNAMTVPLGHSSLVVSEEVYRRVVNTLRPPHEHDCVDEPVATD